jgi:hypothetical protein
MLKRFFFIFFIFLFSLNLYSYEFNFLNKNENFETSANFKLETKDVTSIQIFINQNYFKTIDIAKNSQELIIKDELIDYEIKSNENFKISNINLNEEFLISIP